ncbi:MAG: hypothetical protein DRJ38_01905 [Thermoprotei archaeon]|nr:MAG: hypothetical protein DRJ38_01905 [Thermoprotei archaeon]
MSVSQASTTAILDQLEKLLMQASQGRDNLKPRILSLLSNLEHAIRTQINARMLVKATGGVITEIVQSLKPVFQAISFIRGCVHANEWETALKSLYAIETEKGETLPGLREAIMQSEAALMLATHGFREEAAMASPSVPVTPPPDLIFGVPALVIPLYNMLVREGEIEKEVAARRLGITTEEQRGEFEHACSILISKGYAELRTDRKGRQYLVYTGGE